jgi:hypothetical protein
MNDSSESTRSRFVPWAVIVVLAAGVWAFIIVSGVLSRDLDGGIFLSTTAGIHQGLPLYSGVWDNKDPLFYGVMTVFSSAAPVLGFVMDWFWIALAAAGTALIARRVVSLPTSLLLGCVAAPFLIVGPAYQAGMTNTPGTAVALLSLGLLMNRWYLAAGIGMGLLLFLKITVFPVMVLCALVLLVFPTLRRGLLRVGVGLLATVVVVVGLMAALGWLPGYLTMLQRNRNYAGDVIVYFGFADSLFGHLERFGQEWAGTLWLAGVTAAVILIAGLGSLGLRHFHVQAEQALTVIWLVIGAIGIGLALSMTYVWPHHAQALSFVAVLAVIVLAQMLEQLPWPILSWALILLATFLLSGWSSPSQVVDRYQARLAALPGALSAVNEVSKDARLLNTVPASNFAYMRLGSNDDGGFLGSVRPGAVLACPEFHAYDFSPAETFARLYECLGTVDVVLKADSFDVFGNGGKAGNVRPLLDYVKSAFNCLVVEDRQLCTRKGF